MKTEIDSLTLSRSELEDMAACIELIGAADFPVRFSRFCMTLCLAETVYTSAFFKEDIPATLYSSYNDEESVKILETYNKVAFVLDPFFLRFKQGVGDEVLELSDFAPSGFFESEYFKTFYSALGLESECGLTVRIDESASLFFRSARRIPVGNYVPIASCPRCPYSLR